MQKLTKVGVEVWASEINGYSDGLRKRVKRHKVKHVEKEKDMPVQERQATKVLIKIKENLHADQS